MPASRRHPFPRSSLTLVGTILFLSSCSQLGGSADAELSRETFIATYADLRMATLSSESGDLTSARRDSVLNANGVTVEQLLDFATVHGADAEYMREVWNAVGTRMDGEPDSSETSGAESAMGLGPNR